ncbi:MAG TPA: gephyrin-like molybdotransferase Glp [Acidobacteriota bacterium]|nr:gephyrin-like molybdotransferase Glp [Acidobacteriota bacterium]
MISVEQAVEIVLGNLPARGTERVSIQSVQGRVLAADLTANCDVPPFNRSAMDGYAVCAADTVGAPVSLEIAGESRAGGGGAATLRPGRAVSVMTGAPVPADADAVQVIEQTKRSDDGCRVTVLKPVHTGENIVPRGSEAASGEIVLEAGRLAGPSELAVLATFGYESVMVWRRPSVALLTTGDELVEVHEEPHFGQIRNSNAHSLRGQLRLMGIEADYLGIARDDKQNLRDRMAQASARDVTILTGGVSMGEYDFVKEVLHEVGFKILFAGVAMRPGKPTVFARRGDRLAFGLPGNPVSTFIAFENFVRPALGRLCGIARPELPRIHGALTRDMKQSPGRTAYLPAQVRMAQVGWEIEPLRWRGSADIIGFARANAAVIFPADRDSMKGGETAEALLLPDYFQRSQAR